MKPDSHSADTNPLAARNACADIQNFASSEANVASGGGSLDLHFNSSPRQPRRRVEYEADDRLYESQSTAVPHWSERVLYGISAPEPLPELFGDRYSVTEPAHSPGEKLGFLAAHSADEFGGAVPQSNIAVSATSSKRASATATAAMGINHGSADSDIRIYASGPTDDRRAASRAFRLAAIFYFVPAFITIYGVVLLLKVSAQHIEEDVEEAWSAGDDSRRKSRQRSLRSGNDYHKSIVSLEGTFVQILAASLFVGSLIICFRAVISKR